MKSFRTGLARGSRKILIVLAAFGLLLGGFLGVAAAAPEPAPTDQAAPSITVRTEKAKLDRSAPPTTRAAISYRHLWCGVQGDSHLNLTGLGAYNGQPVAVTIAEAGTSGSEVFGAARMRVNNVAVWNGNVTAWVSVEWGSPLCVWTHYVAI